MTMYRNNAKIDEFQKWSIVIDCICLSKDLDHVISLPVAVLGGKQLLRATLRSKYRDSSSSSRRGRQRQFKLLLLRLHHLTFTPPETFGCFPFSSVLADSIISNIHFLLSHMS